MSTTTDVVFVILMLGAAQGFLLSVGVLTSRRGNRPANRFLAVTLLVYSAGILIHALGHGSHSITEHNGAIHHAHFVISLFFLIGPALFLYTRSLTLNQKQHQARDLAHAVPFIAAACLTVAVFWIEPASRFISWLELMLGVGVVVQTLLYSVAVFRLLVRHTKFICANFSNLKKRNLDWLRAFFACYLIMWVLALVMEARGVHNSAWDYSWILVSFFMYAIGYLGLRQPEIFSGDFAKNAEKKSKKYERSTMTEQHAATCLTKLDRIMNEEKPYLEPDITMPALASRMTVSPHHLSRVINERLGQNFFEMINQHRIGEVKKQILDPKNSHLNLAAIGLQCGFNSLSSFNSAFKRFTGVTPSEFRRSQRPQ